MNMFSRSVVWVGLAAAALTGCAVPQNGAVGSPVSWMLPAAKSGDLLYVSSPATNDVYVYTYPGGEPVGTLTGFENPLGLCSDARGDVWVTNGITGGTIVEYAHGGVKTIARLSDSGFLPLACSVDPMSGNLAVGDTSEGITIWKDARGQPRRYSTSCCVTNPATITYDNSGDAFFADFGLEVGSLPKGASNVVKVALKPRLGRHGSVVWDGKYLAIFAAFSRRSPHTDVIRYKVSGDAANEAGSVTLDGFTQITNTAQFWIEGPRMVLADTRAGGIYLFRYPEGGNPTKTISGLEDPLGITVSVAGGGSHAPVGKR